MTCNEYYQGEGVYIILYRVYLYNRYIRQYSNKKAHLLAEMGFYLFISPFLVEHMTIIFYFSTFAKRSVGFRRHAVAEVIHKLHLLHGKIGRFNYRFS
jgi:hypothetical protein